MAQAQKQESARDRALTTIDSLGEDLTNSLPQTLDIKRFKAAFLNLAIHRPEIFRCTPESLRSSLVKCAADGLVPDGRLAAIVPFRMKIKLNGKDQWVDVAQYIPMYQGLISRARELGETFSVTANVVFQNDIWSADETDPEDMTHTRPALNQDRGNPVGAYVIFRDEKARVIHREIMDLKQLMRVKAISRAKEGNVPWVVWPEEMMRKTVIRRGSKYIPMSAEMRQIIDRDDELYDLEADPDAVQEVDPNYNPLKAKPKAKVIDHQASPEVSTDDVPDATREGPDTPAPPPPSSDRGGGSVAPQDDGANPPAPAEAEAVEAAPEPTTTPAPKKKAMTRENAIKILGTYSHELFKVMREEAVSARSDAFWEREFPGEETKLGRYATELFQAHLARVKGGGSPAEVDAIIKRIEEETSW